MGGKSSLINTMMVSILTKKDSEIKTYFKREKEVQLNINSEYSISLSNEKKPLFKNLKK